MFILLFWLFARYGRSWFYMSAITANAKQDYCTCITLHPVFAVDRASTTVPHGDFFAEHVVRIVYVAQALKKLAETHLCFVACPQVLVKAITPSSVAW